MSKEELFEIVERQRNERDLYGIEIALFNDTEPTHIWLKPEVLKAAFPNYNRKLHDFGDWYDQYYLSHEEKGILFTAYEIVRIPQKKEEEKW